MKGLLESEEKQCGFEGHAGLRNHQGEMQIASHPAYNLAITNLWRKTLHTGVAMVWEWLHSLPSLAKFALGMAIIVGIPPLSRRARLPAVVGLLLSGVVLGPHGLGFFGNSFFIPIFFVVTGFLIDPVAFFQSITTSFPLVSAVIGALLIGKWIAAQAVGRAFAYSPVARMTMWSLTLPQVAATLAATLVAFDTRNPAGQRLIDNRLLNVVLVLMLTTSVLGPVLTEHFAPRLLRDATPP